MRSVDFTPFLLATVLLFVVLSSIQFFGSLAAGERGLLAFEKACPVYNRIH